jgi:hypothetical protein
MSKYGDLIKEARKTENLSEQDSAAKDSGIQETKISSKQETENSRKQENKNPIILESKKISIPENKKTVLIENQAADVPEVEEEKLAGISIKVPENLRRHWVVESKRKGKSMTSVIIEALTKEFGSP